ncbi:hypothetical protein E4T43_05472 [Aureobasidium subglaciale]|nr:hypothetical protein E4T43_05472 [Aureobasidium subglaciale]
MSSPYSNDKLKLCGHQDHHKGCVSCKQDDMIRQLREGGNKLSAAKEAVGAFDSKFSYAKNSEIRANLEKEKKKKQQHVERGEEQIMSLKGVAALVKKEIEAICAGNEPGRLSQAFEEDAAERQIAMAAVWRKIARTKEEAEMPKYKSDDPSREMSSKALDLSNIKATPDYVLKDPTELALYLRAAKGIENAHPMNALGKTPGPAAMSYGAAIASFGAPSKPGDDWPSEDELAEAVAGLTIDPTPPARLETELDPKKQRYGAENLVESVLSEKKQWALFGSSKFLRYTDMLVAQRRRKKEERRQEKKKEEDKKEGKQPEESSADDGSKTTPLLPAGATADSGWPEVEELDWNSLTNWVHRCKEADKAFGRKTLPKWEGDRLERFALAEAMMKWNLPAAIAGGFDVGYTDTKPPSTYYNLAKPIADIDGAKCGFDIKTGLAQP